MNAFVINTFNTLCKNTSILFFVFLFLFFTYSPLNAATSIINNGFETGNLSGYAPHVAGGTVTVATSPIATGKYSGHFNLNFALGNYRAETYLANGKGYFAFEKEYWLGFNYRYENWANDTSAEIAPFQIHTRPSQWTNKCQFNNAVNYAPFLMLSQNDEARFYTYGGKILWKAPIKKNQWQKITVHFKISTGSTGYIEAWKDGVKIGRVDGPNSPKYDNCGGAMRSPYWNMGIYKWDWRSKKTNSSRRQLFIDNLKIDEGASTYSSVTSTSTTQSSLTLNESNADSTTATDLVTENNLVAHWPMNTGIGTTTPDASGNGYTATLANGAQLTTDDGGVKFDGVDDYVNAGNPKISGKAMTASAWVWSDDLDNCPKRSCNILSKATGFSKQDQDLAISTVKKGSKTRLRFRLNIDGATSNLTATSGDIQKGEWIHVAVVFTGKKMRLYQNGVRVGGKAQKGSITLRNQSPIWIGGNPPDATSRPWKGRIDDVRIYNYALTSAEIAELAK